MTKEPHTNTTRLYVQYALAFGVSVGVGLLPLLGKLRAPGFVTILNLYPLNLQAHIIAFVAFLMGLPALAVQFYVGDDGVTTALLRRWFPPLLGIIITCCFSLMIIFTVAVADVPFQGGSATARYVVGYKQQPDCPCRGEDIETCVGARMSYNPQGVERCFPAREIRLNKLLLSLPYTVMMLAFGTLIGVLILRERRTRPSAAEQLQKSSEGGQAP